MFFATGDLMWNWLQSVIGIFGTDLPRELLVALAAIAVAFVLPLGKRRRLVQVPIIFLLLAPLPIAAAGLFPESIDLNRFLGLGIHFFLITSIVQSLLIIFCISIWEQVSRPMPKIFFDVLRWSGTILALFVVLLESGADPAELFTGSAVLTAVMGFALKDTLGNVFAGLAIHAEQPFELGDWIQYDTNQAHIGKVTEINWRATKVITLDEAEVIIPNGQLAQASIRNFTKPQRWSRRCRFVVAPYEESPQRVQQIMLEAIRGSFGVLEHPAASVVTNDFKERGIEYWVRLFTTEFDKRDRVDGMARDRIWYALARHGIKIPVATQAIRLTHLPTEAASSFDEILKQRKEILSEVDLLGMLSEDQMLQLASDAVQETFASGEEIIRQGDLGSSMFIIESGNVDVTVSDSGSAPTRLAILSSKDVFGEMSLMTGAQRSATVTALVESRILRIDKPAMSKLLTVEPLLVKRASEYLVGRQVARFEIISQIEKQAPSSTDLFERIKKFFAI